MLFYPTTLNFISVTSHRLIHFQDFTATRLGLESVLLKDTPRKNLEDPYRVYLRPQCHESYTLPLCQVPFNAFKKRQILDSSKLKKFADDNCKF